MLCLQGTTHERGALLHHVAARIGVLARNAGVVIAEKLGALLAQVFERACSKGDELVLVTRDIGGVRQVAQQVCRSLK